MSHGATLTSSPAKSIYVYRNGDTNFQCKKVVVNPRQVKNWDAFIELITARVKARNGGAVRRVFTPTGRTTVSDLTNIENNHFYVAAGAEGFKRHQYNKISALSPQKTRLSTDPLDPAVKLPPIIKPVQHSRLKVSARCKRAAIAVGSKVIYVFRNGDANSPAVKILFTKFMLKNYDVVLNEVTRKVNIMTGAVWKLHSLDGKQLLGPEEFEDHEFYVACGRENFKRVPYPKDGVIVSPRVLRPAQVRKRITRLSKDSKSSKDSKASKESRASKPAQTEQKKSKPSKPSKPSPPKIKKEKSPEQKEAEEVFHHKPTMVKRSRERESQKESPLDYSDDPEGVFKAKEERNETKGAAEVQETVETAIDLPIDQVAAEEVEEEEDLDLAKDDEAPAANQEPTPEPPKLEPVNLVDRMLEDDEVPEEVPEDAPPAVDDNNGVVNGGGGDDDEGGVNGSSGDGGVGGAQEEQTGGAEEKKKEEKTEEEQPNAFLTDDLGENTNEEPAGFYSKRSPVTSKISPIITGSDDDLPVSPPASNERTQSPNENNNNSAENKDVPLENRDDQVIETAGSPEPSAKQESLPAVSPTKSIGRVQTPSENNNKSALSRENSSHIREGLSRISPHPPTSKRSVPPSPAPSNRRSVTPKENLVNAESRPQSQSGEVANSAPSPQAPSAEQLQNGQVKSPVENNTPRPVSGGGQNAEATVTPHPPTSPAASNAQAQLPIDNVNSQPVSRDAQSERGGDQIIDSAPSPQPPAPESNPTPAGSSGPAQSPTTDAPSKPESIHAPPESDLVQSTNSSASPNPPPPSEPNNPASPVGKSEPSQSPVNRDVPPENGGDLVNDSADTKDNEASPPQKVVENAADTEPREGEVAA